MYYDHQVRTGQVQPDDQYWGGLYIRYTLSNYLPRLGQDTSWIPGRGPFQEAEAWHGAPMAAIWRAFLILGNPQCGLPDEETRLLRELQDLYKRKISLSSAIGGIGIGGGEEDGEDRDNSRGRNISSNPSHSQTQTHAPTGGMGLSAGDTQHQSGPADHNPTQNEDGKDSMVDSAIELRSKTSNTQLQDVCFVTQKLQESRRVNQRCEPNDPTSKLPRHRPRSNPMMVRLWEWGPASSSRDKIDQLVRGGKRLHGDPIQNM